ncbi:hypothetical protein Airi02_041410 [Actinoallomurus iriomotensis]|uniref:Uncharacterized protein n=1 Tax=Actinoallomurus iriomotensis TaxID=478107 RepID=A0A9W6W0Y4_9ACTN|nr:hypothetical protein Airi02_041410 [Actinoallomurus iriomotensis]
MHSDRSGHDPTRLGGLIVADAWLPGAVRLQSRHDGGSLRGGAPRAVWHTSEHDPLAISARSVAQHLEQRGTNAHIVWNPFSGEIMQMVPATQAALLLPDGVGREGRRCLQILVVGLAREPFTDGAMQGIGLIVDWLDAWQVPRRWPAGDPLAPPEAYSAPRDRRPWARGGHFGVSQVPHAQGPAPGAIDTSRITGPVTPPEMPRITVGEVSLPGTESLPIAHLVPGGTAPEPPVEAPTGPTADSPPGPAPVRASTPT